MARLGGYAVVIGGIDVGTMIDQPLHCGVLWGWPRACVVESTITVCILRIDVCAMLEQNASCVKMACSDGSEERICVSSSY